MATGHSLPLLPPLDLPEESLTHASHLPGRSGPNSISFSPTPSFAESFSTALTSSSQADLGGYISSHAPSTLVPPQNLRKSVSVDSFVSSTTSRVPRSNTNSGLDPPRDLVLGTSVGLKRENQNTAYIQPRRNRGYSIGSTRNTTGDFYVVDSDVERSEPLSSPIDRYRHISLKGQDQPRPLIRGGELPLPSRTPTLSTTSSISSIISTPTTSTTLDGMQRQLSLTSLPSFPSRDTTLLSGGRMRSGSLGTYTSAGKRMHVNINIPSDSNSAIKMVVAGTTGCGKSFAIRRGLRGYALSEPTPFSGPSPYGTLKYSLRVGRIPRNETSTGSSGCALHVFEVDVSSEISEWKEYTWPDSLSAVDGAIICYDSSSDDSFKPIEALLQRYRAMKMPIIVLACKSDLARQVEPEKALEVLQQYDVGLVEVARTVDPGKDKMRRTFEWLLKAIFRDRRTNRIGYDANYRNPASPDVLVSSPPWEVSRPAVTATSSAVFADTIDDEQIRNTHTALTPTSGQSPMLPTSPTRARSTGDLLYEHEQSRIRAWNRDPDSVHRESNSADPSRESGSDPFNNGSRGPSDHRERKDKDKETWVQHITRWLTLSDAYSSSRPAQWATLEELLDKLLFLAVSGDDPAYITHFLLTYRRFASPRKVLLAMQKRMRQLDNPSGDPMFACFAQMRICFLLELWIRDYPYDFAVRGTSGALAALIKSIISKTYLLHYGSEFLPFLEMLPDLVDQDAAWALKVDDVIDDESDDSYSLLEDEENPRSEMDSTNHSPISSKGKGSLLNPPVPSRERKPSLPLPLILASGSTLSSGQTEFVDTSERQQIKDLVKLAQEVLTIDSDEIAQEITRVEIKLFLDIQPRHWLSYTFMSGKKDEREPITAFNSVSNHLADWVVSLILCHDRPRARAKQIEKFVDIAHRLRTLNNYSALRAFVAGINNATYVGDETTEQFKLKSPEQAKILRSLDVLLQSLRSHRAYRLALKNTKGACIPALEVHMSDLIKAHEGNEDLNPSDPTKIHWGKFNMMGKFIGSTAQCQARCRMASDYNFPDRQAIKELFVKRPVMSGEMQKARIASPDADNYRPIPHPIPTQPRDAAILRKLFFW